MLFWQGSPTDHSGAYYVILCTGQDGKPVEIAIENPDCHRLEIPGLLDSGWEPKIEHLVEEFFASATTCCALGRPLEGVYVNDTSVSTIGDLRSQLQAFYEPLIALLDDPDMSFDTWRTAIDTGDPGKVSGHALLIYLRAEGEEPTVSSFHGLEELDEAAHAELSSRLTAIGEILESESEGFVQVVTASDWRLDVPELVDILTWWLWGTTERQRREIGEGW